MLITMELISCQAVPFRKGNPNRYLWEWLHFYSNMSSGYKASFFCMFFIADLHLYF